MSGTFTDGTIRPSGDENEEAGYNGSPRPRAEELQRRGVDSVVRKQRVQRVSHVEHFLNGQVQLLVERHSEYASARVTWPAGFCSGKCTQKINELLVFERRNGLARMDSRAKHSRVRTATSVAIFQDRKA
jgi:hypothetical protein